MIGAFLQGVPAVHAQSGFVAPLIVGSHGPIVDEFGDILEGSMAAPGDLVQILEADTSVVPAGQAHPPNIDGTPHANNPTVYDGLSGIGELSVSEGAFAHSVSRAMGGSMQGKKLFVRVFNAPTLGQASFYGDSQEIFTVSGNTPFVATIGAADQPIDPNDADFDGASNSHEKSLNTNPYDPDSDNDGMNDGDELRAGTDALDAGSLLVITDVVPSGDDVILRWEAVPGKEYEVIYTYETLEKDPAFSTFNVVVTAQTAVAELMILDALLDPHCVYRVMLKE